MNFICVQIKQQVEELKAAKEELEKVEEAHKVKLKQEESAAAEAEAKAKEEAAAAEAKDKEESSMPVDIGSSEDPVASTAAQDQPATTDPAPNNAPETAESDLDDEKELDANERQALGKGCHTKVRLFGGSDFSGWQARLSVGNYDAKALVARGAKEDDTSSIKVMMGLSKPCLICKLTQVPPGCVAHVYENSDFTGWTAVFSVGEYMAGEMGAAGAYDKQISAVRILNEGDPDPNNFDVPAAASTRKTDAQNQVVDGDGAIEPDETLLPKLGCVMWRQTGGCDPAGPAEPAHDKPCALTIQSGNSGYCECTGGVQRNRVVCAHPTFNCNEACAGASNCGVSFGSCAM